MTIDLTPPPPHRSSEFLRFGRALCERFLGFLDMDPESATHGCFDRSWWHYGIHDTCNARYQECALYLARLGQCLPSARDLFAPQIRAAARFWSSQRHSDGSVDEVYPWERSFCATAMSAQAITAAMLLAGDDFGIDLRPTARWLARHPRADVANQLAASCAALWNTSRIADDATFARAAEEQIGLLIAHQLPTGCFLEYDGPDVGYASITMSLVTQYAAASGSEAAWEAARRCDEWLRERVAPNGLFEYADTSRRTQFLYPSAFARLRSPLLERIERGLEENIIVNPLWMDDRYSIPMATDYLLTHLVREGVEPCA
ncbi:hypothetical protein JW916_02210 [Candidatus Sumerlaeota bacterium]|nr:hypothetical protein [Candidatus Sumerlaeota bacterium]